MTENVSNKNVVMLNLFQHLKIEILKQVQDDRNEFRMTKKSSGWRERVKHSWKRYIKNDRFCRFFFAI